LQAKAAAGVAQEEKEEGRKKAREGERREVRVRAEGGGERLQQ
jgi:hypothetical protein